MNAIVTAETFASQIISPIRGEMVTNAGNDERAESIVAKIQSTIRIALGKNPDLMKCPVEALQTEILACASDNLLPDGKQAAILLYNTNIAPKGKPANWVKMPNYQPMVYGIIKRMREMGEVHSIAVDVVYEADEFHVNMTDPEDTIHKPDLTSAKRGAVVAAYCIIRDKDKNVIHREVMTKSQLDNVRKASKSGESGPWKDWYDEMCKKACLRRASKYITLSNDSLTSMIERLDAMFDFSNQNTETVRANPFVKNQPAQQIENNSTVAEEPTSSPTEAKVDAGGSVSEKKTEPPKENKKTEKKEEPKDPVTMADIQAYSDFLWHSPKRTTSEIHDRSGRWVESNRIPARNPSEEIRVLSTKIKDIHVERMVAKGTEEENDAAARLALTEIKIESPEVA